MKQLFFAGIALAIPIILGGLVIYMFLNGIYTVISGWRLSRELREIEQESLVRRKQISTTAAAVAGASVASVAATGKPTFGHVDDFKPSRVSTKNPQVPSALGVGVTSASVEEEPATQLPATQMDGEPTEQTTTKTADVQPTIDPAIQVPETSPEADIIERSLVVDEPDVVAEAVDAEPSSDGGNTPENPATQSTETMTGSPEQQKIVPQVLDMSNSTYNLVNQANELPSRIDDADEVSSLPNVVAQNADSEVEDEPRRDDGSPPLP